MMSVEDCGERLQNIAGIRILQKAGGGWWRPADVVGGGGGGGGSVLLLAGSGESWWKAGRSGVSQGQQPAAGLLLGGEAGADSQFCPV